MDLFAIILLKHFFSSSLPKRYGLREILIQMSSSDLFLGSASAFLTFRWALRMKYFPYQFMFFPLRIRKNI